MRPNPAATRCWQDSALRWSGCRWLEECLRHNRAAPRFNACAPAAADGLLNLRLDENRELVGGFYGELVDHVRQIEAALLAQQQQSENPEASPASGEYGG